MQENNPEKLNPWVSIWTRPKETMRYILHSDPKAVILWLAIISGILTSLALLANLWIKYPHKDIYRYGLVILGFIVIGAIVGIIHLYFNSWLFKVTGNWLGGSGTFTEVKAAVGWSNYPFILAGILNILAFFLIHHSILFYLFSIIHFIFLIWAIVIAIKLLAAAHCFSSWRSVGAIIIAMLLIIAVVMIISLFIPFFAH